MLGLNIVKILDAVTSRKVLGPTPAFTQLHVMETLEILGSEGTMGRIKISRKLRLGEGSARTMLKHMKKAGLIEGSRLGYGLTRRGLKVYKFFRDNVKGPVNLPKTDITFGSCNVAFLVRKAERSVKYGVEQRDAAIMVGAQGAITLICKDENLLMPGVEETCLKKLPELENRIKERLKPSTGDVIIIGVSEDQRTAELGAKAAVLETLRKLSGG
jgi:hypothetical protein